MKMFNKFIVAASVFTMTACLPEVDHVQNVQWEDGGKVAEVHFRTSDGRRGVYSIQCMEEDVDTPFEYEWEDDCDLNTEVNGYVREWENPEDELDDLVDDLFDLGAGALGVTTLSGKYNKQKRQAVRKKFKRSTTGRRK